MNPILEKIRKLLRMKRGGTPDEIATALRLAQELAEKHGIDLASVNPDEQSETRRISHVEEVLKSRWPEEGKYAAAILVNFFNVEVCLSCRNNPRTFARQYVLNVIGTNWDCEVARYVFAFLQRAFRSAWSNRSRRLKNRSAFLHGMYIGLAYKLQSQRPIQEQGNAVLVINRAVQLRREYLDKHWPENKPQNLPEDDSKAMASKLAGIIAGRQTEIRSGLKGSPAAARPALPPPVGQLALI